VERREEIQANGLNLLRRRGGERERERENNNNKNKK